MTVIPLALPEPLGELQQVWVVAPGLGLGERLAELPPVVQVLADEERLY